MKRKTLFLLPLVALLFVASCDDGTIEKKEAATKEGRVVKFEGTVSGLVSWPLSYDVSVAGFDAEAAEQSSPYAAISKVVMADSSGHVSIVLSGVGSDVERVELCVLNSLRQRVATFASLNLDTQSSTDTIRFDFGSVNVSMFAAVQSSIFNASCAACHGANGRSAAGLNLTDGHSYAALVGQASTKLPSVLRVAPGRADSSLLYQVIDGDVSQNWLQNHSDMLNKERAAKLIKMLQDWIDNGAAE